MRKSLDDIISGSLSRPGIIGWFIALFKPIARVLSMLGDVDLLADYLGPTGRFLDTGWGTLVSVMVGAAIIGYAIVRRSHSLPIASNKSAIRHRQQTQMLPIAGIILGGLIFIVSIAWMLNENRRSTDEITRALTRYVLPRHLTENQIGIISNYLLKFDPVKNVKLEVQQNIGEASLYATDITRALTDGGWQITSTTYVDILREGLAMNFQQTQQSQQERRDQKHPKPDAIIIEAFKEAGLKFDGGSGGGSSINTTENTLTIRIGRRRADDGDLIGRRRAREQMLKQAEELRDE